MSLKLEKISKRINDNWILRDFSLEVSDGEIFGLLGANGSGKSTLLRLIAVKEKNFTGNLSAVGDIKFVGAAKENFSWKNIFGATKTEQNADGKSFYEAFEKTLDTTENILLIDDAFANLDQKLREKALLKLRETVDNKKLTVILTTTDCETAFAVCNRVGILHNGEIVQTGTPREIYENPNSVAAASAVGRNNLIASRRVTFNNQPIPEFQTLVGEHRLQTGKAEKNKLGTITQNVTLAIRPEHISISFGASFPEDNLLKAKIVEIRYAGATTRVKLDADSLILEALVLRLVGLNKGDECLVGLPPDRILILKE